ncbi:MAG: cholesterol oxidase substrate-binding domain-containing protein [Mycobacteriales bacterium]
MRLSRRRFLAGTAGLVVAGAAAPRPATAGPAGCAAPVDFPLDRYQETYQNWAGALTVPGVWTCAPRTADEVVAVVNWAWQHGYAVRGRGHRHSWTPLTVTAGADCGGNVVLVDTTQHLTGLSLTGAGTGVGVRAEAGASLDALLEFAGQAGYGLAATPAPGDLSVGGTVAIDAHGTAVPAAGEAPVPGQTYGSLSDLVTSITVVAWDGAAGRYALRTLDRSDPDCAAFLTPLGRSLITELTLRVGADRTLRCQSYVDISAAELFAAPGSAGRTFAGFLDAAGRAEAIWFPFTGKPWLKVWSLAPDRPLTSRPVTGPYNYPFSDTVPKPVADLAGLLVSGQWYLAPAFGQAQYDAAAAGLTATVSADLWGASRDLLRYVRPTTLRMAANGYAVLTARAGVQAVVSDFTAFFTDRLAAYAAAGEYPVNGPVEIRVTGLDVPADVGVSGAAPPALSALRPRADHPEWDTAVWLDVLTLPTTPAAPRFYRELEQHLFATYGTAVRPEWSKGFAYTAEAAWSDLPTLTGTIPAAYRAGPDPSWDAALSTLDGADPHRVFTNPFLDVLLP